MAFLREKMRSGDDIRRAQILSFAYDSHSINRSAYHTTIIMLGETGVGKVSTSTNMQFFFLKERPHIIIILRLSLPAIKSSLNC
jgi:nucleoside phosphorylase